MGNILLLCGSKGSGKTSAANFVAANRLNKQGIIGEYAQAYDGTIDVKVTVDGKEEMAELNLRRTDYEFVKYANINIYPYVKLYSFADILKEAVANMFGLDIDILYGTNEDKNKLTHIKWRDFEKLFPLKKPSQSEYMTYREVLQYFGTNVCRTIDHDCWVNACLNRIQQDETELAIIDDGRFPNELFAIKTIKNAKVIYLDRKTDDDNHSSETALRKLAQQSNAPIDYFIYNQNLTLAEKNQQIFNAIKYWGWIGGKLT